MAREIITGKYPGGMFVYTAERENREQLARRWFNYGFNDYVSGNCRGSSIDYKMDLERNKADDSRGRWIKKWAEYGFNCAILYYEVLGGEGGYNAYKNNPAFLDLLALDYKKEPPLNPNPFDGWAGVVDGWQLIRAVNDKGRFVTLSKRKINATDPNEDKVISQLIQNVEPVDTEFVGVFYWS